MEGQKIHLIGISGIGMSAIAKILLKQGAIISGSTLQHNDNSRTLMEMGASIQEEHNASNIKNDHNLVIRSSAILDDNVEVKEAKKKGIPVIKRSDMLAKILNDQYAICISGTHGKTSTTSIIGEILEAGNLNPTIINGGIINKYNSNVKFGDGKYAVAECDESDGSFLKMKAKIAVVTNIEAEHMEYYKTIEKLKESFVSFITQAIENKGVAVVCIDDETVREIYNKLSKKEKLKTITYGFESDADYQAFNVRQNIDGTYFDVKLKNGNVIRDLFMPMYGVYQAQNALSGIAIGEYLELSESEIRDGLSNSCGVQRRFTKVGNFNNISIIDDYAHHPTEVIATIKTAKALVDKEKNKVCVVFQPHRYSRVRDLFFEFCHAFFDADILLLTDIYSANEEPIKDITQENLAKCIRNAGYKNLIELRNENELAKLIAENTKNGDIVLCLGAGSISNWARNLQKQLEEIS